MDIQLEFQCSRCHRKVVAQNELAAKWMGAGKGVLCDSCRRENIKYTTMPYQEYLKTERWLQKAGDCYRRFNYGCALCGSGDRLEAHHRTYDNRGNESAEDLTALCHDCHRLVTAYQRGLIQIPELD